MCCCSIVVEPHISRATSLPQKDFLLQVQQFVRSAAIPTTNFDALVLEPLCEIRQKKSSTTILKKAIKDAVIDNIKLNGRLNLMSFEIRGICRYIETAAPQIYKMASSMEGPTHSYSTKTTKFLLRESPDYLGEPLDRGSVIPVQNGSRRNIVEGRYIT